MHSDCNPTLCLAEEGKTLFTPTWKLTRQLKVTVDFLLDKLVGSTEDDETMKTHMENPVQSLETEISKTVGDANEEIPWIAKLEGKIPQVK